jgi:hypothetical protein
VGAAGSRGGGGAVAGASPIGAAGEPISAGGDGDGGVAGGAGTGGSGGSAPHGSQRLVVGVFAPFEAGTFRVTDSSFGAQTKSCVQALCVRGFAGAR